MKFTLEKLGLLDYAELELGDLTIICGENNTGKTYATYSVFGFLYLCEREGVLVENTEIINYIHKKIMLLSRGGTAQFNLGKLIESSEKIFSAASAVYTDRLADIFSTSKHNFKDSSVKVNSSLSHEELHSIIKKSQFKRKVTSGQIALGFEKNPNEMILTVTSLVKKGDGKSDSELHVGYLFSDISAQIISEVFSEILPRPLIASAERTGAAIFKNDLDFARNRLLDEISREDKIDPIRVLMRRHKDYALPVKLNVEFIRNLESISKNDSFLCEEHPDIFEKFSDIIGGEYKVTRNEGVRFKPKRKTVSLSMDESSSAVRSLLDVYFYLRHSIKKDDILMIDEPELNLHPANQRRIARLLARLVNIGIKVFITTHSDYIVKELNTLIMLNQEDPHLKKLAEKEGYTSHELLKANQIKLYIAESALTTVPGGRRKTKRHTLTPASVTQEEGIDARSFDTTINKMNDIQDQILWGGES